MSFNTETTLGDNMACLFADNANVLPESQQPAERSGNRCGHDPESPRFDMIEAMTADKAKRAEQDFYGKQWRPAILLKLMDKARDIYTNPENHLDLGMHHTGGHIVKCRGANRRQIRTEKRETNTLVLATMILHMDLSRMMVGYYDKKTLEFKHYTYAWLAEKAGIGVERFKKGVKFWQDKHIITTNGNGKNKVCEQQPDGTYRGRACPKAISKHIFAYFSLDKWLADERKKASQRLSEKKEAASAATTKKQKALAAAAADSAREEVSGMLGGLLNKTKSKRRVDSAENEATFKSFLA